jgi:hypothetical protein
VSRLQKHGLAITIRTDTLDDQQPDVGGTCARRSVATPARNITSRAPGLTMAQAPVVHRSVPSSSGHITSVKLSAARTGSGSCKAATMVMASERDRDLSLVRSRLEMPSLRFDHSCQDLAQRSGGVFCAHSKKFGRIAIDVRALIATSQTHKPAPERPRMGSDG